MRHRHTRLIPCLVLALALPACQELPTDGAVPASSPEAAYLNAGAVAPTRAALSLPAGIELTDDLSGLVSRAINPADYTCPPSTGIGDFINAQVGLLVAQEQAIIFELLLDYAADLVVLVDAILATDDQGQSFGYNGEYTQRMWRAERSIKGFWDIPSEDILVLAMKGSILTDVERVASIYVVLGVPPVFALQFAERVAELIGMSNLLNGGNHPIFSYNAFAQSNPPPRIVLGDGILDGYASLGLDDVAPTAVFAHEFSHHIQFANGYFNDPIVAGASAPERTRYTELMADAFAAYYLTHKRGATYNRKRVEQFFEVFFQVGDCAFTNPNHHGTPNQRMAAARFGFDVADATQKKGMILTSEEFHDLFVAVYPDLIAPDV